MRHTWPSVYGLVSSAGSWMRATESEIGATLPAEWLREQCTTVREVSSLLSFSALFSSFFRVFLCLVLMHRRSSCSRCTRNFSMMWRWRSLLMMFLLICCRRRSTWSTSVSWLCSACTNRRWRWGDDLSSRSRSNRWGPCSTATHRCPAHIDISLFVINTKLRHLSPSAVPCFFIRTRLSTNLCRTIKVVSSSTTVNSGCRQLSVCFHWLLISS